MFFGMLAECASHVTIVGMLLVIHASEAWVDRELLKHPHKRLAFVMLPLKEKRINNSNQHHFFATLHKKVEKEA
jgi:hypothetical protein